MKRTLFRTDEGLEFFGEVNDVPGDSRSNPFRIPQRILKVEPETWLTAGEVIVSPFGRRFLCAEHGDGLSSWNIFRSFRLFELDRTVEIFRRVEVIDDLTGLKKTIHNHPVGSFDTVFEPLTPQEEVSVPFDRYRMLTGSEVFKDDLVDEKYRVVRVEKLLGIYVSEIQ